MPWSCILQFSKVLGFHVRDILSLILHKIEIYHCKLKKPYLNLCSNHQYIFIKSEILKIRSCQPPLPIMRYLYLFSFYAFQSFVYILGQSKFWQLRLMPKKLRWDIFKIYFYMLMLLQELVRYSYFDLQAGFIPCLSFLRVS